MLLADSDKEAMDLGRRAWPRFQASFMKLWKKHGTQPRFMRLPEDFDAVVEAGFALAGGPATVREQVGVAIEAAAAITSSRSFRSAISHMSRRCVRRGYSSSM